MLGSFRICSEDCGWQKEGRYNEDSLTYELIRLSYVFDLCPACIDRPSKYSQPRTITGTGQCSRGKAIALGIVFSAAVLNHVLQRGSMVGLILHRSLT